MSIKVSVVKCSKYDKELIKKTLLNSLKNIDFKIKQGMNVLIKPNLLCPSSPEKGITTHPIIIEELCKILKKHNSKIFIGDSSSNRTELALIKCGIKKLSKYAKIINFDNEECKNINFKNIILPIPKIIFDMDLIINISKMKTHLMTDFTLCIKNLYGCIPGDIKSRLHKTYSNKKKLFDLLLRLHEVIKPKLNIIDGIYGIEGDGPSTLGRLKKPGLILTSKNAIAIDLVGSKIMGFTSEKIFYDILTKKKEKIEVLGNGKRVKINFKKPFCSIFPKIYPSVPLETEN